MIDDQNGAQWGRGRRSSDSHFKGIRGANAQKRLFRGNRCRTRQSVFREMNEMSQMTLEIIERGTVNPEYEKLPQNFSAM